MGIPERLYVACHSDRLLLITAAKNHRCIECGLRVWAGEEYVREPERGNPVEAWCRACAWRLFGPAGEREQGWVLDADSPEAEEHQRMVEDRIVDALDRMWEESAARKQSS